MNKSRRASRGGVEMQELAQNAGGAADGEIPAAEEDEQLPLHSLLLHGVLAAAAAARQGLHDAMEEASAAMESVCDEAERRERGLGDAGEQLREELESVRTEVRRLVCMQRERLCAAENTFERMRAAAAGGGWTG